MLYLSDIVFTQMIVVPIPRGTNFDVNFSVVNQFFLLTIGKKCGTKAAARIVNYFLAFSSLGNIIVTTFADARGKPPTASFILGLNAKPSPLHSQTRNCKGRSYSIWSNPTTKCQSHLENISQENGSPATSTTCANATRRPARGPVESQDSRPEPLRANSCTSIAPSLLFHLGPHLFYLGN